MKKPVYRCDMCGCLHEGDFPPKQCPQCKVSKYFTKTEIDQAEESETKSEESYRKPATSKTPLYKMSIGELRSEWIKTFFSKKIVVALPVALLVGVPLSAIVTPLGGCLAGMYAGIWACHLVFGND